MPDLPPIPPLPDIKAGQWPHPDLRIEPYDYQKQAIDRILAQGGNALVFDSPGLGKTLTAITAALHLSKRTLIVCPANAKYHWQSELRKVADAASTVIEGRKVVPVKPQPFIIINYDILRYWLPVLKQGRFDMVVFDEAHYVKNITAKVTKAMLELVPYIPRKIFSTGTPLHQGAMDMFPLFCALDEGYVSTWQRFGERFAQPRMLHINTRYGQRLQTIYSGITKNTEHRQEFTDRMAPWMIRRKKADVVDQLPPITQQVIYVDLSKKAQKEYDAIKKDFLGWLREQDTEAAERASRSEALGKLNALLKVCVEDKLERAIDFIEERSQEGKILVFSQRTQPLKALEERLGKDAVLIDGTVTSKKRHEIQEVFQSDDSVRVFLGQVQAAGEALNLPAADTVLFLDPHWSPGRNEQAMNRAHRINDLHPVHVYYLATKGTIEEIRMGILLERMIAHEQALGGAVEDAVLAALRSQ